MPSTACLGIFFFGGQGAFHVKAHTGGMLVGP